MVFEAKNFPVGGCPQDSNSGPDPNISIQAKLLRLRSNWILRWSGIISWWSFIKWMWRSSWSNICTAVFHSILFCCNKAIIAKYCFIQKSESCDRGSVCCKSICLYLHLCIAEYFHNVERAWGFIIVVNFQRPHKSFIQLLELVVMCGGRDIICMLFSPTRSITSMLWLWMRWLSMFSRTLFSGVGFVCLMKYLNLSFIMFVWFHSWKPSSHKI